MTQRTKYASYKVAESIEWIDIIPDSWQIKPLFSVCRNIVAKNENGEETNVLSLSYGKIIKRDVESNMGLLPESFDTYQVVEDGDLVLRLTDLQNDKRSLRVGRVTEKGIITSAYLKLTPMVQSIQSKYLYYLLHAYDIIKVFYSMGGGLRQSMKFYDMRRLPLVLPSNVEQQQIASFLDYETSRIDTLIEKQRRLIELLKEKRQAVISHAVTRGLDPDVPLKESGVEWLGKVPEHWQTCRIKNVTNAVIDGPHFSPLYQEDGFMFISARNVKVEKWSFEDAKYISERDYKEFCKRVTPEVGDVLLTKGGTTGIARAVDFDSPFQVWVHIAVLKTIRTKIDPFYLAYSLNSKHCYDQSQLSTYGATNNDLGLSRIKRIYFALPSIEEQREIATDLDQLTQRIDSLVRTSDRVIELLQEKRSALISAAVTGKIDVSDWTPPEKVA